MKKVDAVYGAGLAQRAESINTQRDIACLGACGVLNRKTLSARTMLYAMGNKIDCHLFPHAGAGTVN